MSGDYNRILQSRRHQQSRILLPIISFYFSVVKIVLKIMKSKFNSIRRHWGKNDRVIVMVTCSHRVIKSHTLKQYTKQYVCKDRLSIKHTLMQISAQFKFSSSSPSSPSLSTTSSTFQLTLMTCFAINNYQLCSVCDVCLIIVIWHDSDMGDEALTFLILLLNWT